MEAYLVFDEEEMLLLFLYSIGEEPIFFLKRSEKL